MNKEVCGDSQEILSKCGGLHILLFDPEKSTLAYTKSMLNQAFYTVISTGEQSLALKMLADNAELIDLIMIDDKKQEMDCTTFITKLKAIMESIPIVLLSSKEFYLSATLIQIGACRVMTKPINSGEVKSLWKFANGWKAKANRVQAEVEDKEESKKSDPKGKGKEENRKRVLDNSSPEKCDSDYDDDQDEEERANERKRCRTYTNELHKKCLEIAENKMLRISEKAAISTFSNPFAPSSTFLRNPKDNAGKSPGKSGNLFGLQFLRGNIYDAMFMRSDGGSMIQHPSMNLDFGFPTNPALVGPTSGGIAPTTRATPLSGVATNSNASGMQSRTLQLNQSSYFGEKRIISNDLKRFSKLVDNQASFLASNGEYMRKRQLSDSQFQAPPTANTSSYSLNNLLSSNSTELLPPINYTWKSVDNNIAQSTAHINQENNALSALSFDPPTAFGSAGVFQESDKCKANLPSDNEEFDEISMDEFLKGLFDKPEGSTRSTPSSGLLQGFSSTPSSGLLQGFEANPDHSKMSTSNLGSFTENGSHVQQGYFGNGAASDEDILNDIARQMQLEGMF